ncbi:MAG: acetylxylan esterase [Chthonomonadales bacterium]
MPLIDLPLDELKTYAGRNPKPADHAKFWADALAELDTVDPKVELKPAAFTSDAAECFHLTFTGVGGARVHAKYLRPKSGKGHRALLQFHGYSGHSGDWLDKLSWVSQGFCVASMDCRGQGGLSEDTGSVRGNTHHGHIVRGLDDAPERMLYRQIFLDTVQLARIVMGFDEVDEKRIGATGWSQGGGLTIACAALEPRIKRAAPVYPFLSDYLRVWEMDLTEEAYRELRNFFRMFDPLHERKQQIFERLGYIDVQHLADRITAEILMPVGLMDKICPPSTQFAAYNKIQSKKNLLVYPDFGHESLPGCHDRIFEFMSEL